MFKSTTLMEQKKDSPMIESASIESYVNENNDHWLYETLEYNDRMHENHVNSNIGLYKLMCEDARGLSTDLVIQENVFANFIQRINKFIEDLIMHIHNFFANLFGGNSKYKEEQNRTKREYEDAKQEANKPGNDHFDPNKIHTVKKYHVPDSDIIGSSLILQATKTFWISIEKIINGEKTSDFQTDTERDMKMYYSVLNRSLKGKGRKVYTEKVKDEATFKECIRQNILYYEEANTSFYEYQSYADLFIRDSNSIVGDTATRANKDVTNKLNQMKNKLQNVSGTISEEAYKAAAEQMKALEEMVRIWLWSCKAGMEYTAAGLKNIRSTLEKMVTNRPVNESSTIHGEEFNSDTLFANEDMRDFGSSEWLDLSLTTETYQVKFELDNFKSRVALGEAQILSDEEPYKIKRLIAMREAEEKKLANTIQAIFARIKEFIQKFFDKLKGNHKVIADFINRNMDAINKPINPQNKYSSRGDVLAGMYRVQDRIDFVDFNYETMKDELKDKDEFFRRRIAPKLNKDSQYSKRKNLLKPNEMTINEFCKTYYGASMPEDKFPKCEFTGEEFERNKQNIVKFLQRSDSFLAGIRDDIRNLESELKKVDPTANTNDTTPNATNGNASTTSNDQQSTQESYYSVLYGKYLTEMEIDNGGGDDKKDAQGNEQKGMDQSAAFKVYMDIYKSVLLSKLTAAEFVVSELSQVIRKHATENMNSEQRKKENDISEKNKAANGPKQNDNK